MNGRWKEQKLVSLDFIALHFVSFYFILETAVLPDPPVSNSSRPMPYCRQDKESDSHQWHEGYVQNTDI